MGTPAYIRRHASLRSQGGYTLIEVLMVVGITAVIMGPLLAWGTLVLRQQPITRDGLVEAGSTGLLGAYFPGDVAVAGVADDMSGIVVSPSQDSWNDWDRDDCGATGIGAEGANGRVLLLLLSGTGGGVKTVYTEAPHSDNGVADPSIRSIWRRQCNSVTNEPISSIEVFEGVGGGTANTRAICWSASGDLPCRQIKLETRSVGHTQPISLQATRRLDLETIASVLAGNFVPKSRITVVSQSLANDGTQRVTVVLSGANSGDPSTPGGSVTSYRWKLPLGTVDENLGYRVVEGGPEVIQQTFELSSAGTYSVGLTVTDNGGASTTTYKRIDVANRAPIATGSVSPTTGAAGTTVFSFSSAGSADLDGTISRYEWVVTGDGTAESAALTLADPNPSFTFPVWSVGHANVTLNVWDNNGALSTWVGGVDLTAPVAGPPETLPGGEPAPTTTTTTTTPPVDTPGDPVAPVNLRQVGSEIYWDPVVGTRRYLVDFRFQTPTDCLLEVNNQAVAAGPNPKKSIPMNLCPASARSTARVGVEFAQNGPIAWSDWIDVTPPTSATPGDPGGVVK